LQKRNFFARKQEKAKIVRKRVEERGWNRIRDAKKIDRLTL